MNRKTIIETENGSLTISQWNDTTTVKFKMKVTGVNVYPVLDAIKSTASALIYLPASGDAMGRNGHVSLDITDEFLTLELSVATEQIWSHDFRKMAEALQSNLEHSLAKKEEELVS